MSRKLSINEWLSEYRNVDTITNATQLQSYGKKLIERNDLIEDLFTALEDETFHETYLESICDQLYKYYKKDNNLKLFTFTYLPTLIGIHLRNCNRSTIEKLYHNVDIFLLGIYNLEIIDEDGETIKRTFRLPNLSKPSIYHEPYNLASHSSILTEHVLHRLEAGATDNVVPSFGPYSEYDCINSGNRMTIITVLMKVYNQFLSSLPKISHTSLCQMVISILENDNKESNQLNNQLLQRETKLDDKTSKRSINYTQLLSNVHPKIMLNSTFLTELLHSIYFCIFNDCPVLGYQALEAIHKRALNSLHSDVLLMSMAIKNSLKSHPSGQIIDGSMGISLTSPTSANSKKAYLSKTILTNASFRSKKLPDDIPIVTSPSTSASGSQLISINEDANTIEVNELSKQVFACGSETNVNSSSSSSLSNQKIMNANKPNTVLNLLKERTSSISNKEKRRDSSKSNNLKHSSNSSISSSSKVMISQKDLPEIAYKPFNDTLHDAYGDVESDTSGISEPKTENYSSDHETITLVKFQSAIIKPYANNVHNNSDDTDGSSSLNDNTANLPLLIKRNDTNKHNETIKV